MIYFYYPLLASTGNFYPHALLFSFFPLCFSPYCYCQRLSFRPSGGEHYFVLVSQYLATVGDQSSFLHDRLGDVPQYEAYKHYIFGENNLFYSLAGWFFVLSMNSGTITLVWECFHGYYCRKTMLCMFFLLLVYVC